MKIILITPLYLPAPIYGVEKIAHSIALKISELNEEAIVLTTNLYSVSPFRKLKETRSYEQFKGIKVVRLNTYRFPRIYSFVSPSLPLKLLPLINKGETVIHAHGYLSLNSISGIITGKIKRTRTVLSPYFHPPPYGSRWRGRIARYITARLSGFSWLRFTDVVLYHSDAERKLLLNIGVPPSKLKRIFPPVEIKEIPASKEELRETLGINKEEIVILYTGRIGTEILNILSEVARLSQKYPIKIVCLGGEWGVAKEFLQKKVQDERLKSVLILKGYVSEEEKNKWMKSSDIFLRPTYFETFGLAFIEAMYYGLPVISNNTGALPEFISNEEGFLVEPQNVEKMISYTELLVKDTKLREEMSKKARAKAMEILSRCRVENYLAVYRELLSR